jgi:hypothetical protein
MSGQASDPSKRFATSKELGGSAAFSDMARGVRFEIVVIHLGELGVQTHVRTETATPGILFVASPLSKGPPMSRSPTLPQLASSRSLSWQRWQMLQSRL